MSEPANVDTLRAERDLYRRLLELGTHDALLPFLDDALALVVEVTGASRGYLELRDGAGPPYSVTHGCTQEELHAIRAQLSGGIMAEAIGTGKTISTASAMEDPRFSSRDSVQASRIQAVLCAPIGSDPAVGVLYLQGRATPGPFPESHRALLELCARALAPLSNRLLKQHRSHTGVDHTAELRGRLKLDGIAGTSRALATVLQQVLVASNVDITVLFTGESGTGKTEFARALHHSSRRANGPFVELNCAAIPEALFEAELFGAEKGAHSTATRRMPGKLSAAQHGTLFLDEIGELPPPVQAKLLQVLQSRTYYALGSTQAQQADVRIIAATNADLEQRIAERTFREDLYYRLNVLTVRVPPLRERTEDIPAIAESILARSVEMLGRSMSLSTAAMFALTQVEWPGNVRQLAGALQRAAAVALSENADVIEVRHVLPERAADAPPSTYQEALRQWQRSYLQQALEQNGGNVSETARRIGLARSHLHELLRTHALHRTRPS